jgi:predicted TIM-barrel enzyme
VFTGVNFLREQPARLISLAPCVPERYIRIDTERETLFLAAKSILEPSEFRAGRRHFEIKAAAIK